MLENNKKLWTLGFISISLINVLLFFGYQLQLSTIPVYLHDLSGSNSIVGISAALTTGAAILARPFAGMSLDRIGRKKVLLFGAILMIAAFFLYTILNTVVAILFIRFITGLGWGISTTSSNTIATDVIPRERFGEGMGYFSLSQSLSLALAPVIGLALYASGSFKGVALTGVCLIGIAAVISFTLPTFKMKREKRKFAPYEKSAIQPAVIMMFVGFAISTTFSYAVLYGRSMGFERVGLFFTLYAITLFVTRPIIGRVIDKLGLHSVMIPGFLGLVTTLLLLCFTKSEIGFFAAALLQGVCYGALQTSIQAMAVINSPADRRGAANATYFTGFDLGIGVGGLIAGFVASYLGYSSMFGVMGAVVFTGFILYVILKKNVPDDKQRGQSGDKLELK
jgi:MFS family permease